MSGATLPNGPKKEKPKKKGKLEKVMGTLFPSTRDVFRELENRGEEAKGNAKHIVVAAAYDVARIMAIGAGVTAAIYYASKFLADVYSSLPAASNF